MKKIVIVLTFLLIGITSQLQAQITHTRIGEEVKVKGTYVFNVVSNGWDTEIIIINKAGNVLLTFIPFKIQDGWQSFTSKNDDRMISKSGTSYTYFYRVAEPSGGWCDIPNRGLQNIRNIARYVVAMGLVKNETLDKTAFDQFCLMHGQVYENLKYFK